MAEPLSHLFLSRDDLSDADRAMLRRAYALAETAHAHQRRASGEPYITHPLAVAAYIADMGFDVASIAAALLHDVVEDTPVTRSYIQQHFGHDIAFLVDGVTKLSAIQLTGRRGPLTTDPKVESLKKMFFAMAEDVRVIIIKLADRLHNMRTLGAMPPHDRERIARETLEIYAPIAARLGMGNMRGDLEDLAFPFALPDEYARLMATTRDRYADRLRYIQRVAPIVRRRLTDAGIPVVDVHARVKHHYSLWQKLKRYDMDPDRVMDLVAMRVLVPDTNSCYAALGVVHTHYRPLPGRIKDYIAVPKPNGYRSLHTTVFCEKGRIAEIQIRTPEMHDHAENGVAAHWAYAESGKRKDAIAQQQELAWINQLKATLKDIKNQHGVASLKLDFFKNRIFVFTPKGDVKDLPEGATAVDFAYAIHSDLGHALTGAKINSAIAPLSSPLANGDVVEILKGNTSKPSWDWLSFVRTNEARRHIMGWFKRHDPTIATVNGRQLLNRELARVGYSIEKLGKQELQQMLTAISAKTLDDALLHISMGDIDASQLVRTAFAEQWKTTHGRVRTKSKSRISERPATVSANRVLIDGQHGLAYRIGKCCSPEHGQPIVGYLTATRGVTVHRPECKNASAADTRRLMKASWG